MKRTALNFICKDEAAVIERMMESVRPIADLIVAVDTGSSDNTMALIKAFGQKYDIPTFVFERKFDNFGNSRNHALDKLREVVHQLGWKSKDTWGFFIDCDEVMVISDGFQRSSISHDFYIADFSWKHGSFDRQLFFRLSRDCRWEGPIHEQIVCDEPDISYGRAEGLYIIWHVEGDSRSDDTDAKFVHYAEQLEQYIQDGHEDFRWVFYTGESYAAAAKHCRSKERQRALTLLAKKYYERASELKFHVVDEKIISLYRLAENKMALEEDWKSIQPIYLQAFCMDSRRAESMAELITHYMSLRHWETAYLFTRFAVRNWHGRNPRAEGAAETNDTLYQWKLLFYHAVCCQMSNRKEEAASARNELDAIIHANPKSFSYADLVYIRSHSSGNLRIREMRLFRKKEFSI